MITYCLHNLPFSHIYFDSAYSKEMKFEKILNRKLRLKAKDYCKSKKTIFLIPFYEYLEKLKVDEEPNYSYLKFLFEIQIIEEGHHPLEDIYCNRIKPIATVFLHEDEEIPMEKSSEQNNIRNLAYKQKQQIVWLYI